MKSKKKNKCSCEVSIKYFDAEGKPFNKHNKHCKVHGYLEHSKRFTLDSDMKNFFKENKDLPAKVFLKAFNKEFGISKNIVFVYNNRARLL